MTSKARAILLSSALTVFLLLVIDQISCFIDSCEADDNIFNVVFFGLPLLIAYLVLAWSVIFPSMLFVRHKLGLFGSAFVISLFFSILLACFFISKSTANLFFYEAQHAFTWFTIPWFFGGLVALSNWPNPSFKRDA
jgi:hypothetical protein